MGVLKPNETEAVSSELVRGTVVDVDQAEGEVALTVAADGQEYSVTVPEGDIFKHSLDYYGDGSSDDPTSLVGVEVFVHNSGNWCVTLSEAHQWALQRGFLEATDRVRIPPLYNVAPFGLTIPITAVYVLFGLGLTGWASTIAALATTGTIGLVVLVYASFAFIPHATADSC